MHDSGYTSEEIDAIVDELLDDATREAWGEEAGLMLALELGLSEGDAEEISERGTVMLSTSRQAIDAGLAAVRQCLAGGTSLLQALQDHPPDAG